MNRERHWYQTLFTYAWVFNTGRGLSVFLRLPHNVGILYDLGRGDDFSPAEFVRDHIVPRLRRFKNHRIAQVVLSHPHGDHIAEIEAIAGAEGEPTPVLSPHLLTCPHDKDDAEAVDFGRVNTPKSQQHLVDRYREAYQDRHLPLQTIVSESDYSVPNVEYGIYFLRPPFCAAVHPNNDQDYTNSLSLVLYLRHGHQSILIPGDITPATLRMILHDANGVEKRYTWFGDIPRGMPSDTHLTTTTQPALLSLLFERGLTVLVAPHHGLESGYCQDLFDSMKGGKPTINVISERRHTSDEQGTVDARYQSEDGAQGTRVDIEGKEEHRFSVSTRDGHHILVVFQGTVARPRVYLRADPHDLLEIA